MQLAVDLSEYPETWVQKAINDHRKSSPFWPSLSDIVERMQPSIDAKRQREEREYHNRQAREFMASSDGQGSQLSADERAAFLKDKYNIVPKGRVHHTTDTPDPETTAVRERAKAAFKRTQSHRTAAQIEAALGHDALEQTEEA